jgi:hypothetical protein
MFSPAAATAIAFSSVAMKPGSSPMTWSAGNIPSTASGESLSIRKAARPAAGAVLRAAGSLRICAAGSQSSCFVIVSDSRPLVMTQNLPGPASGASRSTVCWIMLRSPSRTRTCLARARRLSGQNRVPLPPARMIGRNSVLACVKSSAPYGLSCQYLQVIGAPVGIAAIS